MNVTVCRFYFTFTVYNLVRRLLLVKKAAFKLSMKKIKGKIQKIRSGNAFAIFDDDTDDIFIPSSRLKGAMNGDIVEVTKINPRRPGEREEGKVVKIIEHSHTEVVGRYEKYHKNGFVSPVSPRDNEDIYIPHGKNMGAKNGDMVAARIIKYPYRGHSAEAVITEIIAKENDNTAVISGIIRANGLDEHFSPEVERAASIVSREAITDDMIAQRHDLRNENIITIDGADSKDLDDAVSVKKMKNGHYLLGVHIADVSHYVKPGTDLNREAVYRGTSVYMLNKVVPMLPKSLSNGICSLFEGVDRLTLTCQMEIDEKGRIVDHDIFESVINSKARMVYDDVSDMLEDGDAELIERYSSYNGYDVYSMLKVMEELARILNKKRIADGSIDFDIDEADIMLDDDGIPVDIDILDRRIANRIIEEFMLAANRTIAEHFYYMNVPFIYRVHDKPEAQKIAELKVFLSGFGIKIPGTPDKLHPSYINDIITNISGMPYEKVVNTVILRSMTKAYYSTECTGHFGLAFKYYCHFTSPIRRYPDLMIHRIIKSVINGEMDEKLMNMYSRKAEKYAESSSAAEIRAQDMERLAKKIKMAEYMSSHIGEEFDAVISGAANFAIFAELSNTVEGTIRLESIRDDYYSFDEKNYCVRGENTGRVYSLGMPVRIKVVSADTFTGVIEFVLADD